MSEPYVGEIRMFAGNFAPLGWAICDGTELEINGNDMLYSLIGTTYGGDGVNTFALPDLRGRVPVHTGTSPVGTNYPLGAKGGVEKVTLTAAQLPAHTHTVLAGSANGESNTPTNNIPAVAVGSSYSTGAGLTPVSMSPTSLSPSGGNQPHDNMMQSIAINFIIATQGFYPSQA